MKTLVRCGWFLGLFLVTLALALPQDQLSLRRIPRAAEDDSSSNSDDDDFSGFKDDEDFDTTEKPTTSVMGRIGKLLTDMIQIPINMFKAVNSLFSSQTLSKLRDEMRNLNISYPK